MANYSPYHICYLDSLQNRRFLLLITQVQKRRYDHDQRKTAVSADGRWLCRMAGNRGFGQGREGLRWKAVYGCFGGTVRSFERRYSIVSGGKGDTESNKHCNGGI